MTGDPSPREVPWAMGAVWVGGLLFSELALALALALAGGTEVVSVRCSDGVLLRASDPALRQGGVGVVEVRSDQPLAAVEGRFDGRALHFWSDTESRVFQALLGVDLYKRPGDALVSVRAVPNVPNSVSLEAVDCRLDLSVADGDFPVQKLRVAPEFVELSRKDLARSRRENAELARIFDTTTMERLWRGGFESPVPGYAASGSFGKRRVFNNQPRSPHSGEDFSAPAGSPVRAPARGRVVLAESLFFLGNTVVLDHGFALYSFFGHLSAIDVETGTIVDTGAMLGKVGATGRVTGAHLHWGVRLSDARVNPMDLLALGR